MQHVDGRDERLARLQLRNANVTQNIGALGFITGTGVFEQRRDAVLIDDERAAFVDGDAVDLTRRRQMFLRDQR